MMKNPSIFFVLIFFNTYLFSICTASNLTSENSKLSSPERRPPQTPSAEGDKKQPNLKSINAFKSKEENKINCHFPKQPSSPDSLKKYLGCIGNKIKLHHTKFEFKKLENLKTEFLKSERYFKRRGPELYSHFLVSKGYLAFFSADFDSVFAITSKINSEIMKSKPRMMRLVSFLNLRSLILSKSKDLKPEHFAKTRSLLLDTSTDNNFLFSYLDYLESISLFLSANKLAAKNTLESGLLKISKDSPSVQTDILEITIFFKLLLGHIGEAKDTSQLTPNKEAQLSLNKYVEFYYNNTHPSAYQKKIIDLTNSIASGAKIDQNELYSILGKKNYLLELIKLAAPKSACKQNQFLCENIP